MNSNTKDTVISLLRSTGREGIERLIGFIERGKYFTIGCHSHHTEQGGMARHALEVYEYMKGHNNANYSNDTLVITALCHDLGKTVSRDNRNFGKGRSHGRRSVFILDHCNVCLTEQEKIAISKHHHHGYNNIRLRNMLSCADHYSARCWAQDKAYKNV